MTPDDPLALATRRRLYDAIRNHPGCHLRELDRKTALGVGALRYHLDELVRLKLVRAEDDETSRRFFPVEMVAVERRATAALRPRVHQHIVLTLLAKGPMRQAEISRVLGLPATTVSRRVRALLQSGLLVRNQDDSHVRVKDVELVLRVIVAYKPSYADRLADAALEMWLDYL